MKSNTRINYDLLPTTIRWSMKVIGKTGSSKTIFVSAFTDFLLAYMQQKFKIHILSPWDRIRNNFTQINNIDEIKDIDSALIICDDSQVQLKRNKTLTEMILNKRHRNISIIQCEQYTQNTNLVQKRNSDYFVSLGTFTLSDYIYFTEKFLSSLNFTNLVSNI